VAAHPLIPEVPLRAGGGFGPLGIDHQLLREGIFLKILSRGNVRFCPSLHFCNRVCSVS
jgi:exopolysaccharide biosynthesis predicted pyruvyltransferase EpsI